MTSRIARTVAFVVAGVVSAAGQDQTPPVPATAQVKVKVSVGDTAAPPAWELSIPVALNVAYGTEAGRVTLRLKYPAKALHYQKVKTTESLRDAGYEAKADKPVISGETGSMALEFHATRAGAKPLPSGTAAILVFKVDKDAPEKTFPMAVDEIKAWGTEAKPAELTAASGRNASFIVTPPGLPILSCFFYMH